MSKTLIVSKAPRRQSTVVERVTTLTRRQRRSRRRTRLSAPRRGLGLLGRGPQGAALTAYQNTLEDPFEFAGVPLGYDCFLPTSVAAAYVRKSMLVNAIDGSFSINLNPDLTNMVTVANPVSGNLRSSASFVYSAANIGAFTVNYKEARFISGGIRVFALFPETSAPGVLFSGTLPDFTQSNYTLTTTQGLCDLPESHLGIGCHGATATIRPYDNASFEFFTQNIAGFTSTSIPFMTSCYIAGLGFPIGTTIWFEAILNIEGIALSSASSSQTPSDDAAPKDTISTYFPTPGALWSAVAPLLTPPVILDAVGSTLNLVQGNIAGAAVGAARIAGRMSRLGSGRNLNNFVQRRGRESSVVLEEMKEEEGDVIHL